MERMMIISSDGHVAPKMRSYREYIDPDMRAEFDDFCDDHDKNGSGHTAEGRALKMFIDEDVADEWDRTQGDTGRIDGMWDSDRRLEVLEGEGVCAEVLIPESAGLPFRLHQAAGVARRLCDADLRVFRERPAHRRHQLHQGRGQV